MSRTARGCSSMLRSKGSLVPLTHKDTARRILIVLGFEPLSVRCCLRASADSSDIAADNLASWSTTTPLLPASSPANAAQLTRLERRVSSANYERWRGIGLLALSFVVIIARCYEEEARGQQHS